MLNHSSFFHKFRVPTFGLVAILVVVILIVLGTLTKSFAQTIIPDVEVCNWLGCKTGAGSFSIDDGNAICKTDLENAGFRGTYYYDGGTTQSWFKTFSTAGHEVGSHLYDHQLNCTVQPACFPNCTETTLSQTPYTLDDVNTTRTYQMESNISAIEAGTGKPVVSMAWPCGNTDAGRMAAASYYYVGSRGYFDPYDSNFPWVNTVNPLTPNVWQNIYASTQWDQTFIDQAIVQGKWAIITTHQVCDGISYMGSKSADLWLAPVGDVLKYIKVRNAAQFSNYTRTANTISFDAVHNLSTFQRPKLNGGFFLPVVYDNAVTLKVHLNDTDDVTGAQINGVVAPFTVKNISGARYALIDTPLINSVHIEITISAAPLPTFTPTSSAPYGCPCSFWDISTVPGTPSFSDSSPIEVGFYFKSLTAGRITGLKFYKGSANNGTHIGHIWSSTGTKLAEATFTNETASGWQTVMFATPVSIQANTNYVASYFTSSGNYAQDNGFFTSALTKGPLTAPSTTQVNPGNGVYRYSSTSAFPNQTYDSGNYWVDVILDTSTVVLPTATNTATATRTATATNTPLPPTATNTPLPPTATNTPLPPTATDTPLPPTATFTPGPSPTATATAVVPPSPTPTATATPLPPSPTPTATSTPIPSTATATPGSSLYGCPCSLWASSTVPSVAAASDSSAVEVGMYFNSLVNANITGLRFYKGSTNTGTHVGHLWTSTGTMLGEATFTNETASGWQTVYFTTPIAILPNTNYIVSYFTSTGHYAQNLDFFTTTLTNGPLTAPASSLVTPGNGVYRYSATSAFPNQTYSSSNYWVDVILDTSTSNTPTPTPIPPDTIFQDSFETGSLTQWSSSATNNGALTVSTASTMDGIYGMQAGINSSTSIYVQDDRPNAEPAYRARFYFDPNSITMANNDANYLLIGFSGTTVQNVRIEMRYSSKAYQIRANVRTNSGTYSNTSYFTISDAPHYIEFSWLASTSPSLNNGSLTLWIDGIQRAVITGLANNTLRIDSVRLGAVSGIDSGTRGTEFFDKFDSHRQSYIGP